MCVIYIIYITHINIMVCVHQVYKQERLDALEEPPKLSRFFVCHRQTHASSRGCKFKLAERTTRAEHAIDQVSGLIACAISSKSSIRWMQLKAVEAEWVDSFPLAYSASGETRTTFRAARKRFGCSS